MRAWNVENGLANTYTWAMTKNHSGDVLISHGDHPYITRYDGYRFEEIPKPRGLAAFVYETPNKSIWFLNEHGISRYTDFQWHVDEIDTYDLGDDSICPLDDDHVILLNQGKLHLYQPTRSQLTAVASTEKSKIGTLEVLIPSHGGGVWVFIVLFALRHVKLEKLVSTRTSQLQELNVQLEFESMELKNAHEKLQHANDELEYRVDERSKVLADLNEALRNEIHERRRMEEEKHSLEQRYYHSQRMESIGVLAGGIAHDFNNLLTGILGNCELILLGEKADSPLALRLKSITDAGNRAVALVQELLTFSRNKKSQKQVVELNRLIEHFQETFSRLIREDVEFSFVPDKDIGRIKADPIQLEQVITNLVVNARDAMPDGGKLTIQTSRYRTDGDILVHGMMRRDTTYVKLIVQDTGIGMDDDTIGHIFEPFYTTKVQGKGTGLGLATVYGIIKDCEGFIEVDSALGQGTTFSLYFPECEEAVSDFLDKAKDRTIVQGHETILIVGDEEMVLHLVRDSLTVRGFQVLTATNGEDALQMVRDFTGTIDLLISDIVLPMKNGVDTAKEIQAMIPDIRVLFVSGYSRAEYIEKIQEHFQGNLIQKPFHPDEFLQKVKESLLQPVGNH